MSYNVIGTLALACVMLVLIVTFIAIGSTVQEQVYDCSIAEFHPDYPKEVKEKCREIRLQRKVIDT